MTLAPSLSNFSATATVTVTAHDVTIDHIAECITVAYASGICPEGCHEIEVSAQDGLDDCARKINDSIESWFENELIRVGLPSSSLDLDSIRDDTRLTPAGREAMASAMAETGLLALQDDDGDIRPATAEEAIASMLAGPEGWIQVDGRRCYVA